jgi:hypothetical protein
MNPDEIMDKPYWIIDILPGRVPENSPGQYFRIEKYWMENQMAEIRQKKFSLILKLNCYMQISIDGETNPSPEKIRNRIKETGVSVRIGDAMIVSEKDDTYMTLFNPDKPLLAMIRKIASGEGLFVWKRQL